MLGILESNAIKTFGTRNLAIRLSELIPEIVTLLEHELFPTHNKILEKIDSTQDAVTKWEDFAEFVLVLREKIKESHTVLANLKTSFV